MRLFRWVAGPLHQVRKGIWRVTGRPAGVHAFALRADGRIVLVRLTYAKGWRLPGGGRARREAPAAAVLRELREEIGMLGYASIEPVHQLGVDPYLGALFILRGVEYQPRKSWEIEEVGAFYLDKLPHDTSPRTRRWIESELMPCRDAPT